jgi:glycosyltransferase involved in cell wall biosynthesis
MQAVEIKASTILLEKPVRITEQVWPENTVPVVSIFCLTYNHGKFIREAIEGFLMQETTFPVEILIHDDASNDGTQKIIKDYQKCYPNQMHTVFQKENQYSKNNLRHFEFFDKCNGDFIALCEGDDYWTEKNKLQKQVEYLKSNPNCSGCFHNHIEIDALGGQLKNPKTIFKNRYTQLDCIQSLMSSYHTASLVFRKKSLYPLEEWYQKAPYDFFLDLLITRTGTIDFISINASAYRQHDGGIWSSLKRRDQILELIYRFRCLEVNQGFSKYKKEIKESINYFSNSLTTIEEAHIVDEYKEDSKKYQIIKKSKWAKLGSALGLCNLEK